MDLKNSKWLPKLMSLLIACFLWVHVVNEQNPSTEATYKVRIENRNLAEGLTVDDFPNDVQVKIRAPRLSIGKITPEDIKAYINLQNLRDGRYSMIVNADVPYYADLVEILPNTVIIRVYSKD